MSRYRRRLYQNAGSLPETEVKIPTKFQARYESHCVACSGPIAVGTPVVGVRLKKGGGLKWYVWHDVAACHQKAIEALDRTQILPAKEVRAVTEQDELLAAFRAEAEQL